MRPSSWIPDVVVGVDFGMTCTGIAYSWGPEWGRPVTVHRWPGKAIHELANKVPTQIVYDESGQGAPLKWGFLIKPDDEPRHEEFFKLQLDPKFAAEPDSQVSVHEARRWFKDYMRCIYEHISQLLAETFPNWPARRVEFLFGVPTTWKDPAMAKAIEQLIKEAGFGTGGENHHVEIFLTEAEAAAVFAANHAYQKGDIMLVCDAGGGTTDVNLLKVASNPGEPLSIKQLGFVEGLAVGSTRINIAIQKLLATRLDPIQNLLPEPARYIAEKMTYGRFESFKSMFDGTTSEPEVYLRIPGLWPGFDSPELGIEDSKMTLTRQELQARFDLQIERLFHLIDSQIGYLEKKYPNERLSYIVMSGGFGSSPYLRSRLRARYEDDASLCQPCTKGMKVNLTSEPQLSVVHGLVLARIQQIKYQEEIFKQRCCRASYGLVVQDVYDPARHMGEEVWKDPRTKVTYATNQIDWLIKQGESVLDNSIKKPYQKTLDYGNEDSPWKVSVVMYDGPVDRLPRSLKSGEARVICRITTELSRSDMKLKNRKWYQSGPKYYRANFTMNVILRVMDLRFQLLAKDGRTCSRDHEDIRVEWGAQEDGMVAMAANGYDGQLYRG